MRTKTVIALAALLCGLLMVGGGVWAMTSTNYAINWDVIGGGGEPASSANYTARGTIGQPAAETSFSTNYQLGSGYWQEIAAPPTNQPPTAYIDSITPDPATQGVDTVSFTGHGTDPDGSVVAYNWRSSIDGQLSTSSSFTQAASDLSVGTHTIYFKVQDDEGAWSTEDAEDVTILPSEGDILAYYRGLGSDTNVVETMDLLKAINDWANGTIPPSFSQAITTMQLLQLISEWAVGP